MNKTYITHYVNLHNIDILQQLLGNINKNSAIAALVIPHSATWCTVDIALDRRNVVVLDKSYINKYCDIMCITERTFKKAIKELQPVLLQPAAGTKDTYYINPFFVAHGDGQSVAEFREFCVKNKLFVPFIFAKKICKSIDADAYKKELDACSYDDKSRKLFVDCAEKNEEDLQDYLERDALSYNHSCLYTNLDRAAKYTAFANAKLGTTDVFVLLLLSSMTNYTKHQSDAECNNIVTISVKKQKEIAAKLGISDRALRLSISKLCDLSLLHKCSAENGKYIVNPCISAKGEQKRILSLQHNFVTKFYAAGYFNRCVTGDIKEV